MTLNWIGTRTHEEGIFNPTGLDRLIPKGQVGLELLPRGSLMMEVAVRPQVHPVNLLRYNILEPWPSGITVSLEPDGMLRLSMRQGARRQETTLKTTLGSKMQTVHITFIWDAPNRKGVLSAHTPDHGLMWQTEVLAPFPVSLRDVERILTIPNACTLHDGVGFVAIADAPCPLGPIPGLSGSAAVDTPRGPIALRDIKAGDYVNAQGCRPVQVLWAGQASVPTLGRFAPILLRRPYMRLWDDLIAAQDQRACLSGSEVEYLFGEERVTTAIRHLESRNCAAHLKPKPAVITYHQILLKTHEIITVNGAAVESFDGSAVLGSEARLKTSVLADMPAHMRPRQIGLAAPVLQGYEALTLTGVSIG